MLLLRLIPLLFAIMTSGCIYHRVIYDTLSAEDVPDYVMEIFEGYESETELEEVVGVRFRGKYRSYRFYLKGRDEVIQVSRDGRVLVVNSVD